MAELTAHLVPFMLAIFRLAGVFLIAPVVASTAIPTQARALLVFAIGAAILPGLKPGTLNVEDLDVVGLGWAVAGETLIGFCIGLLMMMPVAAVQLSGLLMGQQMGFGLAQVYNPALDAEVDLLGDLLGYIAIGVFLTIGGLEGTFLAVMRSFEHLPLGKVSAGAVPLELMTGMLRSGFELATRVSLPLMGIILIETIATAFVTKTLPQANINSIGFAVKIVLGLIAIIAGLRAADSAIFDHVSESARLVLRWASGAQP